MRGLTGNMAVTPTLTRLCPAFLNLGSDGINRPDPRQALWIYAELAHLLDINPAAAQAAKAAAVYRPDLFDRMSESLAHLPDGDGIGLRYGPEFHGDDLSGYIRGLGPASPRDLARR